MAAITPSNLYIHSMGSLTLRIADMNTASNGDTWDSGITDIVDVISHIRGSTGKLTASCLTWTVSNGIINFQNRPAGDRLSVWVVSGFGNK